MEGEGGPGGTMNVKRQISVQNHGYQVDVPDSCPVCHRHSEMQYVQADWVNERRAVHPLFRGAYLAYRQFFVCTYGPDRSSVLVSVRPIKPDLAKFPDEVAKLSPTFVSIFAEAEEATQLGLRQIAGPGYRK